MKPAPDFFGPAPSPDPPRILPHTTYRTHGARMLELAEPETTTIDIEDIAHHLARVCRYGGSVDGFYSVAEHCVYMSRALQARGHAPYVCAAALLHDSAEAYLGDMVSGLKRVCPEYRALEARWEDRIQKHFGVYWRSGRVGQIVKDADLRARLSEVRDLFAEHPYPRHELLGGEGDRVPYSEPVVGHSPAEAEWLWCARARELGLWPVGDES